MYEIATAILTGAQTRSWPWVLPSGWALVTEKWGGNLVSLSFLLEPFREGEGGGVTAFESSECFESLWEGVALRSSLLPDIMRIERVRLERV